MASDPARLVSYTLSLPFGLGTVHWEEDKTERRTAWALYVELVTRVAVQPLDLDYGVMREALSSLHSLFSTTREILREAGPDVGARPGSIGGIAIAVLVKGVAPFLSEWHPKLQDWETDRPADRGVREHERLWPQEPKLRAELEILRLGLIQYAEALATMAGVSRKE